MILGNLYLLMSYKLLIVLVLWLTPEIKDSISDFVDYRRFVFCYLRVS